VVLSLFATALFIGTAITPAVAVGNTNSKESKTSHNCSLCAKTTTGDSNTEGGCEDCIESMMNAIDISKNNLKEGFSEISKRVREVGKIYPGITGDVISAVYHSILKGLQAVEFKEPDNLIEIIRANINEFLSYPISDLGKLFAIIRASLDSIFEWLLSFCFESNEYTQNCYSSAAKRPRAMASSAISRTSIATTVSLVQNSKIQKSIFSKQTSKVSTIAQSTSTTTMSIIQIIDFLHLFLKPQSNNFKSSSAKPQYGGTIPQKIQHSSLKISANI